ncbi:DUF3427 domain-containing protein [Ligilactobacillus equi]
MNKINEMKAAVLNSFLDKEKYQDSATYAARLIANERQENMHDQLKYELQSCQSFTFAVAFVTEGALLDLKVWLQDLAHQGIQGRILTSTYQNFNHPKVFTELAKLPNVEVRIYQPPKQGGFHAKGYLFDHGDYQVAMIGSSNLTERALTINKEWNLRVTSHENGQLTSDLAQQIETDWEKATPLTAEWIAEYRRTWVSPFRDTKRAKIAQIGDLVAENVEAEKYATIRPNQMQAEALHQLQESRLAMKHKALVISATGTGKTYLGAFDVAAYKPKRFLFIVHREQILQKALESFHQVIGGSRDNFGIWSGNHKQNQARYLFATIQTISKEANLHQFAREEFDYILVDEAHRAGAQSYQKVLAYFQPHFLLGMTATPERSDDENIYELFDYNVAYEIRLQDALNEDMLAPFHYVGLKDYEYQGEIVDDQTPLAHLVSEERVDYVLEQSRYYGHAGEKLYGLVFVSRKEEAQKIAELLTQKGYPAQSLTGADSQEARLAAIAKLERGELAYLVTVDIFNEGIDIPFINQVIMMRQTQSAIVFVQQLGRGLRKAKGKDYLTVIDFIGNYKNNYLIPVALTGDNSRTKDGVREKVNLEPTQGISTINFTQVAKDLIFKQLEKQRNPFKQEIIDDFHELKRRLGRIPLMTDFIKNNMVEPQALLDSLSKRGNYNDFLQKIVKEEGVKLGEYENKVLDFLTQELSNGKRAQELLLLKKLLSHKKVAKKDFAEQLQKQGYLADEATLSSVERVLNLDFYTPMTIKDLTKTQRYRYGNEPFVELVAGDYQLTPTLRQALKSDSGFWKLAFDAIQAGILQAKNYQPEVKLTVNKRYKRTDVCRLLNWERQISGQNIGGYYLENQTCPIFVTYHKNEDISETIKYEDEFLSNTVMHCYTKNNRTLGKGETNKMFAGVSDGAPSNRYYLFVKESDAEGKDFLYLGECEVVKDSLRQEYRTIKGKQHPIVSYDVRLQTPVQQGFYHNLIQK